MDFTAWQIDRLRSGLNSYRITNARNGRAPPWRMVIESLLNCPKTLHVLPIDGSEGDFREETLRRFAAGQVIPDHAKLEDIARFLIHEREMEPEELERGEPGTQPLLAAVLALGRKKKESLACLLAMEPEYSANRQVGNNGETRVLRITPDRENPFCRVEEHVTVAPRFPHPGRHRAEPDINTINHGYGCLFTSAHRLMIYVVCNDGSDFAALIEDSPGRDVFQSASLDLRRIDAVKPRSKFSEADPHAGQPLTFKASLLRLPSPP
jgi:hypothetical protein